MSVYPRLPPTAGLRAVGSPHTTPVAPNEFGPSEVRRSLRGQAYEMRPGIKRPRMRLPNALDGVAVELVVGGQDGEPLNQRLGDEQSVERVRVPP